MKYKIWTACGITVLLGVAIALYRSSDTNNPKQSTSLPRPEVSSPVEYSLPVELKLSKEVSSPVEHSFPVELKLSKLVGNVGMYQPLATAWRRLKTLEADKKLYSMRVSDSGTAELSYGESKIILKTGARFEPRHEVDGKYSFNLNAGVMLADIKAENGPIRIKTPHGQVEISEGKTEVSVGFESSKAKVLQGSATIQVKFEGATKELEIAESDIASFDGSSIKRIAATKPITEVKPKKTTKPALGKLVLRDSLGRETDPLEVRKLKVRVRVIGSVALTEIEQTFFNPTARRAEGVFYFPVPAGAALCRFAMYVEGNLVEGELVERIKARQVYEKIVRSMQDPALMEWQEGNIFKTRIFPIPANGPKRILISYTQKLAATDNVRTFSYPLMSKTTQTTDIKNFEFNATVSGIKPGTQLKVNGYPEASVIQKDTAVEIKMVAGKLRPTSDLSFSYTPIRSGSIELATDRRIGEDGFFMMSYMPPAVTTSEPPKNNSRDIIFMFDTSLSRRADDYKAQLQMLRTLLNELNSEDRFSVISFDVEPRLHSEIFTSGPSDVERCLNELQKLMPLGATDIHKAFLAVDKFIKTNSPRENLDVIFIGDGIATLGGVASEELIANISPLLIDNDLRFHAIAMGSKHDRLVLETLANKTGGIFRTLAPKSDIEELGFEIALALDSKLYKSPAIEFSGATVYEVYPKIVGTVIAGEEVIVLGRYKTAGELNVKVSLHNGSVTTSSFELPKSNNENVFIPRLWAREKLDELRTAKQTETIVAKIIELSQEFTLITPYTSFLVLENEAAYKRYDIDRKKRRLYWEEIGKLRTAPPLEEMNYSPRQHVKPEQKKAASENLKKMKSKSQDNKGNKNCKIGALNLTILKHRSSSGRTTTTALAALCLEVYYRYSPMYRTDREIPTQVMPATRIIESSIPEQETIATERVLDITPEEIIVSDRNRAPLLDDTQDEIPDIVPEEATETDTLVPDNFEDSSSMRGDENAITDIPVGGAGVVGNMGIGGGGGGAFGFRGGGGRKRAAIQGGGSRLSEGTVDSALLWLVRNYNPKGDSDRMTSEDTSLALLALLAAGHTTKAGRHKVDVEKIVNWLIAAQKENGQIGPNTYTHAIATIALCETYGMTRHRKTGIHAQKAVDRLLALQTDGSGWGEPNEDVKVLTTAWAVIALKSAKIGRLKVTGAGFKGAADFLKSVTAKNGAISGDGMPVDGSMHLLNTTAGLSARLFMGYKRTDPIMYNAANLIINHVTNNDTMQSDGMYLRYFGSTALFQMGGKHWRKWNAWLRDKLIASQISSNDPHVNGSYEPAGVWVMGRAPTVENELLHARITTGVKEAMAKTGDLPALIKFASLLSLTNDTELLKGLIQQIPDKAIDTKIAVRLRLAFAYIERLQYGFAHKQLVIAYQRAGKPENISRYYIANLCKKGSKDKALDILFAEAKRMGWLPNWRLETITDQLINKQSEAESFISRIDSELKEYRAIRIAIYIEAIKRTQELRLPRVTETLALELFNLSKSEENAKFYISMTKINRNTRARKEFLINTALEDNRFSTWRMKELAKLIAGEKYRKIGYDKYAEKIFKQKPKACLALKAELATYAYNSRDYKMVIRLCKTVYDKNNRPVNMINPYINSLMAEAKHASAREKLEDVIQAGYHTQWAFKSLSSIYKQLNTKQIEVLRAISSEVEIYPRDVQPRVSLAQYFESIGSEAEALEQYTRAIEIRPEDKYFYFLTIERALKINRIDDAVIVAKKLIRHIPNIKARLTSDKKDILELLLKYGNAKNDQEREKAIEELKNINNKDIVVMMSWDTNRTDIDLHVKEPSGEICKHNNRNTRSGGTLDHDDTNGHGPETYSIRKAADGEYQISVVYFNGKPETIVTVKVCRNVGSANETVKEHRVVLRDKKEQKVITNLSIAK